MLSSAHQFDSDPTPSVISTGRLFGRLAWRLQVRVLPEGLLIGVTYDESNADCL